MSGASPWGKRAKRKREVKFQASFEQKEQVKKLAVYLGSIRKEGKELWTMADVLEAIVRETLRDRTYIERNRYHFHPNRPYSFGNSTYFATMDATLWRPLPLSLVIPLSVRLTTECFEEVQMLAYSLDLKVAQTVRKIVGDFLSEEGRVQGVAPGICLEASQMLGHTMAHMASH